MVILYGILYGCIISICFSFGPAFFTLIQTSAQYGFKRAFPIAFGINANDIIVVTLLLTVLSSVNINQLMHTPLAATIGSLALLVFGLYTIFSKQDDAANQGDALKEVKPIKIYFKGLTINMFNPMIWIFWAGFIAAPSLFAQRLQFTIPEGSLWRMFVGVLMATLSLDILKCKIASLLQNYLTKKMLHIFNLIVGLILCGFAVYIFLPMVIH